MSTSGLRWLVGGLVVKVPWSRRLWSLPCLSVLLTTPKVSDRLGRRHKTVAQVAGQMLKWLRRVLPGRRLKVIGDGSYSVIDLGLTAQAQQVTLIAPPPPYSGQGRPRIVGPRLPNLDQVAADPQTVWQRAQLDWYGGQSQTLDWVTGTALWYSTGTDPLPLRWVLVRDPTKR